MSKRDDPPPCPVCVEAEARRWEWVAKHTYVCPLGEMKPGEPGSYVIEVRPSDAILARRVDDKFIFGHRWSQWHGELFMEKPHRRYLRTCHRCHRIEVTLGGNV